MILTYVRNAYYINEGFYLSFYVFSTMFCLGWDLRMDWCFLKGEGLLRNTKMYPTLMYYPIIVVNIFLRFAWLTVLIPASLYSERFLESQALYTILSFLEFYRRAQWSLIRIEVE